VKTIRKVEPHFSGFTEVKESKEARNRAHKEIFLYETKVALEKLPLDEFSDMWTQSHRPSFFFKGRKAKSVETFLKKDTISLKFKET